PLDRADVNYQAQLSDTLNIGGWSPLTLEVMSHDFYHRNRPRSDRHPSERKQTVYSPPSGTSISPSLRHKKTPLENQESF
ncbi:hypothetical protein N9214_01520, partial [bacterium]|nr:hypothetical protein [bacterium]